MGSKKYLVISSGKLVPGFERDDVSSALASTLNIPKEIVSVSLLNQSPRKLKTFDSRLAADKMVAMFRSFGLQCSVAKVEPQEAD
ncbi:MAG: hypothetical protein KTR16_09860 [Acidiferrobacterales bacterium]|nr:hypothetical protein [Acidiferrobacterales bacterium]